ncbi:hypothetical protein SprV_0401447800 [Sparganum proliferum]
MAGCLKSTAVSLKEAAASNMSGPGWASNWGFTNDSFRSCDEVNWLGIRRIEAGIMAEDFYLLCCQLFGLSPPTTQVQSSNRGRTSEVLKDALGEPLTNDLHRSISLSARRIRDARESKLKQKLTTLSEKNASLCHGNVVHNLSSKQLTAEQIKVLSHDACFNTTDAQPIDFIAAAEAVIREAPITEENRNLLRQRISSRLMSHKKRNMLSKAENEALRTLKADKSIVILPADKGRSTVVLNKEDYVNKVEALLGDRTAYIPCEGDMTKTLMSKINKDLASLRKSKAITQLDWQRMKPKDSAIARFYGLPKVHKPGNPPTTDRF